MPTQRVSFINSAGERLAGIVDLPDQPPKLMALFCHCFTCTKDLKAIVKISRGLARLGVGVLRFDFTGLGDSEGNFSATNFETNLSDIASAVEWMNEHHQAPQLLIGMSLGGAALMVACQDIQSARGIVTLAAPSDTRHLAKFLASQNPEIESAGEGWVTIGGRNHLIRAQLLESFRGRDLEHSLQSIQIAHLIFHSLQDETLGYHHAEEIFRLSGGQKTLITLDGADHLLTRQPEDIDYVVDVIRRWATRYVETSNR